MVTIIKSITNRTDKRKIEQEIKRNCKGLDEIERYFILTASQNKDNFKDVFEFFNKEWVNHCKRIVKTKKWVTTIPDQQYFENRYKDFDTKFKNIMNVNKDDEK